MISMGVDLSLTGTGIAYVSEDTVYANTVKSFGRSGDDLKARWSRLGSLVSEIFDEIDTQRPDVVVLEAPAFNSRTGHAHDRSGAWWLLAYKLLAHGVPLATVPPTVRAKYATGAGNAKKVAVVAAIAKRFQDMDFADDNQVDAWVLALMGARHLGTPMDTMPAKHLEAMNAIDWPEVNRG